jgi:hypothetical protein
MDTPEITLSLLASSLGLLLASCSATHHSATVPMDVREISRFVLVIKEGIGGQVTHSWEPMSSFDWSTHPYRALNRSPQDHIVRAVWTRNCEDELDACVEMCMKSLNGPDWSHATRGSKARICRDRCRPAYLDCCRLRDQAEALNFPVIDKAVDWLKRHREEVLVGTVVVIAGVTFVVVVAGTGGAALILAPAVLLASSDGPLQPSIAPVTP